MGRKRLTQMSPAERAAHNKKVEANRKKKQAAKKEEIGKSINKKLAILKAANLDANFRELTKLDPDSDTEQPVDDENEEGSDYGEELDEAKHTMALAKQGSRMKTAEEIYAFCGYSVSAKSRNQYYSIGKSLERKGFEISFEGLASFMVCEDPDCLAIMNSTVDSYISAVKFMLFEKQIQMTPFQLAVLTRIQNARRRLYPDTKRVTGAMTHQRTSIFLEFLKVIHREGRIDDRKYQLFSDAATMLYGCALRFFQLCLLEGESNFFNDYATMEVVAKASESRAADGKITAPPVDNKQVHPLYRERIKGIVQRRKHHTLMFFDFPEVRQEFSNLLRECAILEGWPVEHHFSGTHMFRHGAAQDAHKQGGLELAVARTGHLSQKAAREYARSDEERSDRIEKYKKMDEKARLNRLDELYQLALKNSKKLLHPVVVEGNKHFEHQLQIQQEATSNYPGNKQAEMKIQKYLLGKKLAIEKRQKVNASPVASGDPALRDQKASLSTVLYKGEEMGKKKVEMPTQNQVRSQKTTGTTSTTTAVRRQREFERVESNAQKIKREKEIMELEMVRDGELHVSRLSLELQEELEGGISIDMAIASRS